MKLTTEQAYCRPRECSTATTKEEARFVSKRTFRYPLFYLVTVNSSITFIWPDVNTVAILSIAALCAPLMSYYQSSALRVVTLASSAVTNPRQHTSGGAWKAGLF